MNASQWRSILPALFLCLLLAGPAFSAQDLSGQKELAEQGKALLEQSRYREAEEFFRRWVDLDTRNPDAHYYLALSQALQGNLDAALVGYKTALELAPRMAAADFEIGGIYLKRKNYHEALGWVQKGLRLEPKSDYGLDLAGTLCFLVDSKIEALRYWNKLDRPHLTGIQISSTTRLNRQSIADEIDLKPGSLLASAEIEKAQWRLRQHDYIRSASFLPVPGAQPDQYDLDVRVDSRKGFGTPVEFVANTIAGIGFGTYRLTYWNVGDSGLTISVPFRLKSTARLARFDIRYPRPAHLRIYSRASYSWRDETWRFTGPGAPAGTDYRLRVHEVAAAALVPLKEPKLAMRIELAIRRRLLEPPRTAASSTGELPGAGQRAASLVAQVNGQSTRDMWQQVVWLRFSPRFTLFDRHSLTGFSFESHLQAGVDAGGAMGPQAQRLSRLSVSWEGRLDRMTSSSLQTTLSLGIHAGQLSRQAALEDHFLLGVGPDAQFQLRAHPLFQHGTMGSTPLAGEFVLGNLTAGQDLHAWKWLRLGTVAFLDAAQMPRIYSGQALPATALDAGAGIEIGLRGSPATRFTLTFGHDWKDRCNVFYFSSSFR